MDSNSDNGQFHRNSSTPSTVLPYASSASTLPYASSTTSTTPTTLASTAAITILICLILMATIITTRSTHHHIHINYKSHHLSNCWHSRLRSIICPILIALHFTLISLQYTRSDLIPPNYQYIQTHAIQTIPLTLLFWLYRISVHTASTLAVTCFTWLLIGITQSIQLYNILLGVNQGSSQYFSISSDRTNLILEMIILLVTIIMILGEFTTLPDQNGYRIIDTPQHNPRPPISIFTYLSFGFMNDIMAQGQKHTITAADLWDLDDEFQSAHLFQIFQTNYTPKTQNVSSLSPYLYAVFCYFNFKFFIAFLFLCFSLFLELIQPVILEKLLAFIEAPINDPYYTSQYGWSLIATLFIIAVISPPVKEHFFHRMLVTGMQMRTGVVGAIYKKSLALSLAARSRYTQGHIQTLQSVDSEELLKVPRNVFNAFRAPVQLCVAFFLLYRQLGLAFLPGVIILFLSTPAQVKLTRISGDAEKKRLEAMDKRIKWMGEAIRSILVVKFNTWEEPLLKTIKSLRHSELDHIKTSLLYQSFASTLWSLQPYLIALTCFGTYTLIQHHPLTPQRTFVSLALLRLLSAPVNQLRNCFMTFQKIWISSRRIDSFLKEEEVEVENEGVVRGLDSCGSAVAVDMKGCGWKWSELDDSKEEVIRVDALSIKRGELVGVVGRTGQGKSTLLNALLGELFLTRGKLNVNGKMAYVSQQAWILSGTLRDNILFGSPYNEAFYQRVIEACALSKDFASFEAGDMTEIGERGINLSGGQRQRLSLARAVYSNADIYLLDDPLSAVDMHVDSHIFKHVISETGLLAQKTRIFVTHGIHHLPFVDTILLIQDGRIVEHGQYEELVGLKGEFSLLVDMMMRDDTVMTEGSCRDRLEDEDTIGRVSKVSGYSARSSVGTDVKSGRNSTARKEDEELASKLVKQPAGALTCEEEQGEGSVGWGAYQQYATAFSMTGFFSCLLLSGLSHAMSAVASWWLGYWSTSSGSEQEANLFVYFGVYIGFVTAFAVSGALVTYLFRAVFALRAATVLHDNILDSILQAPMSFFNSTPTGRILNRFSKDMDCVCDALPISFLDTLTEGVIVLTGISVCTFATPLYIFMVLPLLWPYIWLQKRYLSTSRDLRRLHAITRSPIYQLLGETLDGLSTIRAFKAEENFLQILRDRLDKSNNAFVSNMCASRWFDVRIDTVGLLAMVLSAALCVTSRGYIDAAMAGLAMTYATSTAGYLSFFVQDFCVLEVNIVAVERINQYANCRKEAPRRLKPPPQGWPHSGQLVFKKYGTRYRSGLDLVLKDINITIKSGERIGIVGRTGSGKSSLVLSLTRILEAVQGKIFLDGVDLSDLGLLDVRGNITVVPQEPILFATTLRENLDPFYEFSDKDVWRCLERTDMKRWAKNLPLKLETSLSEGGGTLSIGERQLLCMAKAMLRKTRVLVLDEATSSIDIRTDELIQKILREEFCHSTVLCIAHRINTILDSDRILVMDAGRVVEFDKPANLLSRQDSIFSSLCRQYQNNIKGMNEIN